MGAAGAAFVAAPGGVEDDVASARGAVASAGGAKATDGPIADPELAPPPSWRMPPNALGVTVCPDASLSCEPPFF